MRVIVESKLKDGIIIIIFAFIFSLLSILILKNLSFSNGASYFAISIYYILNVIFYIRGIIEIIHHFILLKIRNEGINRKASILKKEKNKKNVILISYINEENNQCKLKIKVSPRVYNLIHEGETISIKVLNNYLHFDDECFKM